MTRGIPRLIWILMAGACALASAQSAPAERGGGGAPGSVERLALIRRPAPWRRGAIAAVSCDGEELLVIGSRRRRRGRRGGRSAFSSRDGRSWREEQLPEPFVPANLLCAGGVEFAAGRPGMLLRRAGSGEWRLAIEAHLPSWGRGIPEFTGVIPDPDDSRGAGRLIASGRYGPGRRFRYVFDPARGRWDPLPTPRPPPVYEHDLVPAPDNVENLVCRRRPPPAGPDALPAPIRSVQLCRRRLLLWTGPDRSVPPEATVPIPASLRRAHFDLLVVDGRVIDEDGGVFLASCNVRVDWVSGRRLSQSRLVRYRDGEWAEAHIEECVHRLLRWRGRRWAVSERAIYEIGGEDGDAPSSAEE